MLKIRVEDVVSVCSEVCIRLLRDQECLREMSERGLIEQSLSADERSLFCEFVRVVEALGGLVCGATDASANTGIPSDTEMDSAVWDVLRCGVRYLSKRRQAGRDSERGR